MKPLFFFFLTLLPVLAYTQVTIETYSNGSKKAEGKLVNDQREGVWYEFNLKGLKVAEGNYVNGVKEGKYTAWHTNGKKQFEGYFRYGKLNSKVTSWRIDGTPEESGHITEDLRDSTWVFYYPAGTIGSTGAFRDGKMEVPQGPGFGIPLNWDFINKYKIAG